MKSKILISSCLLGLECSYKNQKKEILPQIQFLIDNYSIVPVCPEQIGGLPTPRVKQEILNGSGNDVLNSSAQVINVNGDNMTPHFIKGAKEVLHVAKLLNCKVFIGKSKSPSCAKSNIYNGTFTGKLIHGEGVTTAYLKNHGISIFNELELSNNCILNEINEIINK